MSVHAILNNKASKAKEKTQHLSDGLLDNTLHLSDFIAEIQLVKDPAKATCIEALAHVAEKNPQLITEEALVLLIDCLSSKAARVKWESARAIGYTISSYPNQVDYALQQLIANINDEGTVVRWSIAFALGEILKMNTPSTISLVSLFQQQIEREEKKSIQKIYQQALKQVESSF